jgi:hypothetical protein
MTSIRTAVDQAMDAYLDWREECIAVSESYRRWAAAEGADAALAFSAHAAALDREQRASEVYAGLIRCVGDLVETDRRVGTTLVGSGTWRR